MTTRLLKQRIRSTGILAFAGLLVGSLATGCSTTMFTSHPSRMNPILEQVKTGKKAELEGMEKLVKGQDKMLYMLERGRVQEIQGEMAAAKADYDGVISALNEEDSAKTGTQKAGEAAGTAVSQSMAILVNDNAIPYNPPGYERVLLAHFAGLEYLMDGKLEEARVETRRAIEDVQKKAEARQEAEMEKLKKEAGEKKVSTTPDIKELAGPMKEMEEMAGKAKGYTNGYVCFVDGLLREMKSVKADPDGARISYVMAAKCYPTNKYLRQSIARMAVGDENDVQELGIKKEEGVAIPDGCGELVVLFEDGLVPQKQQIKFPLPLPDGRGGLAGAVTIAFPIYKGSTQVPSSLNVKINGSDAGKTEVVCDIRALAVRSLKDQVTAIVIRQTLRALAKTAATEAAAAAVKDQNQMASIGVRLGMSVINYVSENADLRSWTSLPAYAQILRVPIKAGTQKVELSIDGTDLKKTVEVTAEAGKITVVRLAGLGNGSTVLPVQASKPM